MKLANYFLAAFPAVCVETVEEERFTDQLIALVDKASHRYTLFSIDARNTLHQLSISGERVVEERCDYGKAFDHIAAREKGLLLVFDWQSICHNSGAYRRLKANFRDLRAKGSCAILVAPSWRLPDELLHDIPIIDFALPSREQLTQQLDYVSQNARSAIEDDAHETACVDAALGLTLQQSDNSYALAYTESGFIDPGVVQREKMALVKASGYLEVCPPEDITNHGGLNEYKSYFNDEVMPAKDDIQLQVKGILLMGPPGVGKSLAAKVAAGIMGRPLLRMDVGSLKGSLVGQSEHNIKAALRLVDAIAPAVLYIDELEKAVAGHSQSGVTDSGVTAGMVGTILTWMQDHTSQVFTIATVNNYHGLPPEMTRAGRFDERFFVDMPSSEDREDIAAIHLKRLGCDESLAAAIARATPEWTGAEIEQLIKSAARRSNRNMDKEIIEACGRDIKPISTVRADEIAALRDWAKDTLRPANIPDAVDALPQRRNIVTERE